MERRTFGQFPESTMVSQSLVGFARLEKRKFVRHYGHHPTILFSHRLPQAGPVTVTIFDASRAVGSLSGTP